MRDAPLPANDPQRLDALRGAYCAYVPREERFDRITRTLRRLLHVPIALISIVEADEQWFRSAQGLDTGETPRNISFCGHAIGRGAPLIIKDTLEDPAFADNPLVTGPPGIRAYLGWPLEISPGLHAGTLCAIDTIPRVFSLDEIEGMHDLARIAESELRAGAISSLQKTLLVNLDMAQRRHAIDAVTGCWQPPAFRKLLALGVEQARADGSQLALVQLRTSGLKAAERALDGNGRDRPLAVLAQLLRGRMPPQAMLTHLADGVFCALYTAPSTGFLDHHLDALKDTLLTATLPGGVGVPFGVTAHIVRLAELPAHAGATALWAACVAQGAPA